MKTVLMPLPSTDFDPTESAVPWSILSAHGHHVIFATPDGKPGQADPRMVHGTGLGMLAPVLRADVNGQAAYARMSRIWNRRYCKMPLPIFLSRQSLSALFATALCSPQDPNCLPAFQFCMAKRLPRSPNAWNYRRGL